MIAVEARAESSAADRAGPFGEDVEELQIARNVVRAIVVPSLAAEKKVAAAQFARTARDEAKIISVDAAGRGDKRCQCVDRMELA